jgi:C4-dicarboxylate-specific signal transduction histidine kinase
MSTVSIEHLELRAIERRSHLHRTAADLRAKVANTREKLSLSRQTREHLAAASILASVLGFFGGHGVAGLFTRG